MVVSIKDSVKGLFGGCQKDPDLKAAKEQMMKLEKLLEERKWHLQLQKL